MCRPVSVARHNSLQVEARPRHMGPRAPIHKQFAQSRSTSLCLLSIRQHPPQRFHCRLALFNRQLQCDIFIKGGALCFDKFTGDVLAIVWNSHISSFRFCVRKHVVMLARPRCTAVSTCTADSAPIARGRRNLDGMFGRLVHSGRSKKSSKCTCVATRLPVDGTTRTCLGLSSARLSHPRLHGC